MNLNLLNKVLKGKIKNYRKERKKLFFTNQIHWFVKKGSVKKASILLQCYAFLFNKIQFLGIEALLNDFKIVIKKSEGRNDSKSIKEIYSVLEQSAHLLEDSKNSISSILYGYLDEDVSKNIKSLKEQIVESTNSVWLKSEYPNFSSIKGHLQKRKPVRKEEITCLEFVKGNNIILIGYKSGAIEVRDSISFKIIRVIEDLNGIEGILTLKLAQGKYIVAISESSEYYYLSVWDLKKGELLEYCNGGIELTNPQIIILYDGKQIITKSLQKEKSIIIWDLPSLDFREYAIFKEDINRLKLAYLKSNELEPILIIAFESDYIILCNFKNGIIDDLENYFFYKIEPNNLTVSEINECVILWSDTTIIVLDLITGKIIHSEELNIKDVLISIVIPTYDIDEYFVITDSAVIKINLKHLTYNTLKGINSIQGESIEYSNNKKWAFVTLEDKMFKFNLAESQLDSVYYNWDYENKIIINSEKQLITIDDNYIELWELKSQDRVKELNHHRFITSIKLFDLENKLLTTSDDKTIKITDVDSLSLKSQTIKGHNYKIKDADIFTKNDSKYVISIAGETLSYKKSEFKIWDLNKNKNTKTVKLKSTPNKIKVFNNGKYAFIFDDNYSIKIWNLRFGFCIKTIPHNSRDKYLLEPTEEEINLGFKNALESREKIIVSPSLLYPFPKLEFSQDDKYVVIPYFDGLLSVFNFKRMKIIRNFRGHNKQVSSISLLGDLILTGSMDSTVKLWSVTNEGLLKTFTLHRKSVVKVELIELFYTFNHFIKKFVKNEKNTTSIYTLSISFGKKLIFTDLNLNREIGNIKLDETEVISDFKWVPKSEMVILIINGTQIRLVNLISEEVITSLKFGRPIRKILYQAKNQKVILSETNGQIHFLKIENLVL